ncbi:hypothetical protein [Shewanella nanhaiensis]|uniref:Oligosaccharide repeat unit polymerase n=1 Tax=Shewanella nanhaiensis TaxID=2864872 RepID=A0ABS7E6J1_9GAMM|nr:hypothetical protein [Shewanella nanhaiensis]MBW8185209.1 hypothetical protein [Shewanella nanhaiensis]
MQVLWLVILVYLLYVLYLNITSFDAKAAFSYAGEEKDVFKLKNLAYFLIPITVFVFFKYKSTLIFIPVVIISILDLLNGSRTIAFIAIIPIFICYSFHRKSLFIIPGLIAVSLLLLLGVLRTDNVVGGVPWYLSAIGEFRETYITLPLFIANDDYVHGGSIFHLLSAIGAGVLFIFRGQISETYVFAGKFIAEDVDRGYGLASNIIIESAYYGYAGLIFTLLAFPLLLYVTRSLIMRSPLINAIVFSSITVIILRLVFREGLYLSLGALLLIGLFYLFPVFLLNKVRWRKHC